MAGRYVDGNWEEDTPMQQLGQNVGGWINQGIDPDSITRPEIQQLLQRLGFNKATDYKFDPATGYHLYSPKVAPALSGAATSLAAQDKDRGGLTGLVKGFLDKGGGVFAMGGAGMGGALGGAFPGFDPVSGLSIPAGQTGLLSQLGINNPFSDYIGGDGGSGDLEGWSGGGESQVLPPQIGGPTGLDLGIPGLGEASAKTFGGPFGQSPTGMFGAAATAAGGGGFVDSILGGAKNFLKTANDFLGGSGISLADIGKAGANFFLNRDLGNQYRDAASEAQFRANPLNDPQRQGYQSQLSQLLSNPSQFYSQNPVVQAQLNLAKQQFEANAGKLGTGGTVFNDYLKNVQNVAAGTFNDQAKLLGDLGGFGMSGSGGNAAAMLADKGLQQQAESYRGLGQQIFGKLGNVFDDYKSPSDTNMISMA